MQKPCRPASEEAKRRAGCPARRPSRRRGADGHFILTKRTITASFGGCGMEGDSVANGPGQRLLVQRDMAEILLVDLHRLVDQLVALLRSLSLPICPISSSSFGLE